MPVLAIAGHSGAGKTTLLEALIPSLVRSGLAVAVIKHDAHGVDVDRPGKDSDRLFQAGADVVLSAPEQQMLRRHGARAWSLSEQIAALEHDHDLILVEGHKHVDLPKLWLLGEDEVRPPEDIEAVLEVLPRDGSRLERARLQVEAWLAKSWCARPLHAGVLVGGQSARMGHPKQNLVHRGRSVLEATVQVLGPHAGCIVLLGAGEVKSAEELPRLVDAPDSEGPLAGLLAAQRWAPTAAWLIVACDMPLLTAEAVQWLLSQRAPGRSAVLPSLDGEHIEPLFAVYEPGSRSALEALAREGRVGPAALAGRPRMHRASVPSELHAAWGNVNTPQELAALG
ncbi:MAG: molybdopterin-guanine dinucleotide biosynthesis protein B [Pseudomonadota bacterium]